MLQNVCEKFQAKPWKLISTCQQDSAEQISPFENIFFPISSRTFSEMRWKVLVDKSAF